jgi:hypothetical protein
MADEGILDIAHISFLDMIKVMIATSGASSTKGTLIRNALGPAQRIEQVVYDSFEDYLAAVTAATNPVTMIEGRATHVGDYVFGLQHCPFAASIRNYTKVFEKLPDGFPEITAEFNRPSPQTERYHIGEGAGVSPFCAVHQPMRSAIAEKIKIGDRQVHVYQLGCRSGSGKKGFAESWIAETRVPRELVDKVLDTHMCCYVVRLVD